MIGVNDNPLLVVIFEIIKQVNIYVNYRRLNIDKCKELLENLDGKIEKIQSDDLTAESQLKANMFNLAMLAKRELLHLMRSNGFEEYEELEITFDTARININITDTDFIVENNYLYAGVCLLFLFGKHMDDFLFHLPQLLDRLRVSAEHFSLHHLRLVEDMFNGIRASDFERKETYCMWIKMFYRNLFENKDVDLEVLEQIARNHEDLLSEEKCLYFLDIRRRIMEFNKRVGFHFLYFDNKLSDVNLAFKQGHMDVSTRREMRVKALRVGEEAAALSREMEEFYRGLPPGFDKYSSGRVVIKVYNLIAKSLVAKHSPNKEQTQRLMQRVADDFNLHFLNDDGFHTCSRDMKAFAYREYLDACYGSDRVLHPDTVKVLLIFIDNLCDFVISGEGAELNVDFEILIRFLNRFQDSHDQQACAQFQRYFREKRASFGGDIKKIATFARFFRVIHKVPFFEYFSDSQLPIVVSESTRPEDGAAPSKPRKRRNRCGAAKRRRGRATTQKVLAEAEAPEIVESEPAQQAPVADIKSEIPAILNNSTVIGESSTEELGKGQWTVIKRKPKKQRQNVRRQKTRVNISSTTDITRTLTREDFPPLAIPKSKVECQVELQSHDYLKEPELSRPDDGNTSLNSETFGGTIGANNKTEDGVTPPLIEPVDISDGGSSRSPSPKTPSRTPSPVECDSVVSDASSQPNDNPCRLPPRAQSKAFLPIQFRPQFPLQFPPNFAPVIMPPNAFTPPFIPQIIPHPDYQVSYIEGRRKCIHNIRLMSEERLNKIYSNNRNALIELLNSFKYFQITPDYFSQKILKKINCLILMHGLLGDSFILGLSEIINDYLEYSNNPSKLSYGQVGILKG